MINEEENTWRAGERAWVDSRLNELSSILITLEKTSSAAVLACDAKAQAANDALQRLLEANMMTTTTLAEVRYESAQTALTKVDSQLALSRDTALAAVDSARASAMAAVEAVDSRSIMRHDSVAAGLTASEEKLVNRIEALRSLIDLRAQMNAEAIAKAESATQIRFESVNEFRQTLTDQAMQFVTRGVLDATQRQLSNQVENLEQQVRTISDSSKSQIAGLSEQVASLTGKVVVGGSCVMVVLLLVQIFVNFYHH